LQEATVFTLLIVGVERMGFLMILDSARIGHYVVRPPWLPKPSDDEDADAAPAGRVRSRLRHQVLHPEHFTTFPELGAVVGGTAGYWLVMAFLVLAQLGAAVSYTLFLSSNARALVPGLSHPMAVGVITLTVIPLMLPTKLSSLGPVSMLGISCLVLGLALFAARCANQPSHEGEAAWDKATDLAANSTHLDALFRFLGIALFAAEGVAQILPVRASIMQHMVEPGMEDHPVSESRGSGWDPLGLPPTHLRADAAAFDAARGMMDAASDLTDVSRPAARAAAASAAAAGRASSAHDADLDAEGDVEMDVDDGNLLSCLPGDFDWTGSTDAQARLETRYGARRARGMLALQREQQQQQQQQRGRGGAEDGHASERDEDPSVTGGGDEGTSLMGGRRGGAGGGDGRSMASGETVSRWHVALRRQGDEDGKRGAGGQAVLSEAELERRHWRHRHPHHRTAWYAAKIRRAAVLAEAEETVWCLSDTVLATAAVSLVTVGLIGWQCLGPDTPSIVTRVLDNTPLSATIRVFLVVYILCTYPIAMFPVVEAADIARVAPPHQGKPKATVAGDPPIAAASARSPAAAGASAGVAGAGADAGGGSTRSEARNDGLTGFGLGVRLTLVLVASGLALLFEHFSLVLALVGWVCLGGLSFTVPPILRLHVDALHRQAYARYLRRHPHSVDQPNKDQVILLGQVSEVDSRGQPRVGVPPMTPLQRRLHWLFLIVGTGGWILGATLAVVEHMSQDKAGKDADSIHGF
jgi:hypothetical protein